MVPPKNIIGIVAINIEQNNLLFISLKEFFFESWLLNLRRSFLKYQTRAKTLPSWIIADNEGPGSSIPKKRGITFRCAVLLTGINSVKPWIKPYKINLKYSKNLSNFLINW